MKKWIPILIVLAVIALVAIALAGKYNGLVSLEEGVDSQWGNVENVYQRRADLIPNLVETVKGYAAHERETLEAVIKARAAGHPDAGRAHTRGAERPGHDAEIPGGPGRAELGAGPAHGGDRALSRI